MLDTDLEVEERPQRIAIAMGHGHNARSGSPESYFTCKFCQRLFRWVPHSVSRSWGLPVCSEGRVSVGMKQLARATVRDYLRV